MVDAPDLKSSLDFNNKWTGLAQKLVPFFIVHVYESVQKYLLNMLEVLLMAKEMGLLDQNSQKSKLLVVSLQKIST